MDAFFIYLCFMSFGKSRLHEMLRQHRVMSEAVAWYETFTPQTKREILDYIRQDQLVNKGIDATGQVIGYYSMRTSRINPKKKFNTHYTLLDTGEFFKSMYVTVLTNALLIDANTKKGDEDLVSKYGSKILNLTNENLERLKETVKQSYIRQIKHLLGFN